MRRFVMLAAPPTWTDNVKARLARAARVLGITPRRAKSLYYLEAKVIPADEYMALQRKCEEISHRAQAVRDHHEYLRSLANAPMGLAGEPCREARDGHPPEVSAGDDADRGLPRALAPE